MRYEVLVGLKIKDSIKYQAYRDAMKPILSEYGGGFSYDFWIKETLKSESEAPIDRVFVIYFKDKDGMNSFFSDVDYLKVKDEFFEPSVEATTIIAEFTRD
ncbi:MAG: DUF1330 domain-containing protein [Bacteriovorax sp. MedPE-SWde]|nr:MAG: DUF1330 domain-containing protein [Bacteriovorax sp. MedPE-SWde]